MSERCEMAASPAVVDGSQITHFEQQREVCHVVRFRHECREFNKEMSAARRAIGEGPREGPICSGIRVHIK